MRRPPATVADLITRDFGGWDKFRDEWIKKGLGRFGSGYVWLVLAGGKGKIVDTPNAETPLTTADVPLLTTDVWEHAYYLDHRNMRKDVSRSVLRQADQLGLRRQEPEGRRVEGPAR